MTAKTIGPVAGAFDQKDADWLQACQPTMGIKSLRSYCAASTPALLA